MRLDAFADQIGEVSRCRCGCLPYLRRLGCSFGVAGLLFGFALLLGFGYLAFEGVAFCLAEWRLTFGLPGC